MKQNDYALLLTCLKTQMPDDVIFSIFAKSDNIAVWYELDALLRTQQIE